MKLTKKQRNEVYKLALEYHLRDRALCRTYNFNVNGICSKIKMAIPEITQFRISMKSLNNGMLAILVPEFAAMKPKGKLWGEYWWETKPSLNTREKKLRELIKLTS